MVLVIQPAAGVMKYEKSKRITRNHWPIHEPERLVALWFNFLQMGTRTEQGVQLGKTLRRSYVYPQPIVVFPRWPAHLDALVQQRGEWGRCSGRDVAEERGAVYADSSESKRFRPRRCPQH